MGVSGNYDPVDIVIEDTSQQTDKARIKVIIECKGPGLNSGVKPASSTYRDYIFRAYGELEDLRNWDAQNT